MGYEMVSIKLIRTVIALIILFGVFSSGCAFKRMTPKGNWELDRQELDNPSFAKYYFTYFLAIQHENVYDLVHPDLHDKVDEWINDYEPEVCSDFPHGNGNGKDYTILCNCEITVYGVEAGIMTDSNWPYHVVTGWESIERWCYPKKTSL